MTLVIGPDGVENTDSTELHMSNGKVSVGGNFTNSGKVRVFDGGQFEVHKDLINSGDISINDPEQLKQTIIEALKTTGTLAEFGSELLKKLGLFK